jgi:hypothetical protein
VIFVTVANGQQRIQDEPDNKKKNKENEQIGNKKEKSLQIKIEGDRRSIKENKRRKFCSTIPIIPV